MKKKKRFWFLALALVVGLWFALPDSKPAISPPPAQAMELDPPPVPATFATQREVRFETQKGALPLKVAIADTPELQRRGLMHYKEFPAGIHGVLFTFEAQQEQKMWMKNTYIPLDMVFMDEAGKIVHIHENATPLDETTISSQSPALFVLEIPAGMSQKWNLSQGDTMTGI